ncbi:hypothetical protein FB389_1055 [Rarobacter incanus]|uniref:Uncharacterized protein n=1 Tax=Rarobacter incanus TaxID=153494 RepID=A0A542SP27_9MICO|nr:hypothetical protein FB389_1055 [Rarobacter incanus]
MESSGPGNTANCTVDGVCASPRVAGERVAPCERGPALPAGEYVMPAILANIARTASIVDTCGQRYHFGTQVKADPLIAEGKTVQSIWYMTKAVQYMVKDVSDGGGPSSDYGREHGRRLHYAAHLMACDKAARGRHSLFFKARAHDQGGARSRVVTVSDARGRATSEHTRWSLTGLTRAVQRRHRQDYAALMAKSEASCSDRFVWAVAARRLVDGERAATALDRVLRNVHGRAPD